MRVRRLAGVLGAVTVLAGGLAAALTHGRADSSTAGVTTVSGGATAFFSSVSLFGGAATQRGPEGAPGCDPGTPAPGPFASRTEGCSPTVKLPAAGSASPVTSNAPDGVRAVYGPAVVLGGRWPAASPVDPPSGPVVVSTEGSIGQDGSATSSVSIGRAPIGGSWVPPGQTTAQPWTGGVGPGPLIAEAVAITCTAAPSHAVTGPKGVSGSTSITNGVLGLTTDDNGIANSFAPMPASPRPNDGPHHGVITSVGDSYDVFYNEQDTSVPGAITVTAIHMRLLGPTAVGDLYIGRAECGVHVPVQRVPAQGRDHPAALPSRRPPQHGRRR